MAKVEMVALLLCLFLLPSVAGAAAFDGSQPLLCALMRAMECTEREGCKEVPVEDLNIPGFLVIDFQEKTIATVEGDARVTSIDRIQEVQGKLILQGAEEGPRGGVGWTLAIQTGNGKCVLTASGDLVGFTVFGACTPR